MAEPTVAVAITKQRLWHAKPEEFDNVYYFDGPPVTGSNPDLWAALANAVADAERPIHSNDTEFMTARVWSVGGTVVQNITLGLIDLAGYGTLAGNKIFGEAAVLVEWECDRANILGRKVYLRKYIRPGSLPSAGIESVNIGHSALGTTNKAPFKTYADKVQELQVGASLESFKLVSPTGRVPRAVSNGVVNEYLISREFRRN